VTKDFIIFDSEIIPSHYLFCAKRVSDGKLNVLWGHNPDDMTRLGALLSNPTLTWVGFNSKDFDMPIATAAAGGAEIHHLKKMADEIIRDGKPAWMSYRDYGLTEITCGDDITPIDHIDLIEVAPGVMVSLKLYGARMGSPSLVDMPVEHDEWLTQEEAVAKLLPYCLNDLDETERLLKKLMGQIELRQNLSEQYNIDLRSKSDAQMAETIIAKELGILRAGMPAIPATVRYRAPAFVQPTGPILKDILSRVQRHTFNVNPANGAVELPDFLKDEPVIMGNGLFQMGVGGLHSKHDKSVQYISQPGFEIWDADVGAFYPNLFLNAGIAPRNLGVKFLHLYRKLVETRLAAKHEAKVLSKLATRTLEQEARLAECKVADSAGKIQINGTFGKLGSAFSKIYSPDMMLAITMSGQFYLLALIEHLTEIGVTVISANTDGITFGGKPEVVAEAKSFIELYGMLTNFEFEFVQYRRIAFKDVNNYIAVKPDGKIKAKGIYAESGLMKNPTNEVCRIAAQAYLATGTAIKETILRHFTIENFTDFLQARTVKGGAVSYGAFQTVDDWYEIRSREWTRLGRTAATIKRVSRPAPIEIGVQPTKLGRVARWYYSTDPSLASGLRYASSGNLVPKSEGGRACMKLPAALPADVDIQRYIDETVSHLHNMGVTV